VEVEEEVAQKVKKPKLTCERVVIDVDEALTPPSSPIFCAASQ
jgi:hypothetical protein